MIQIKNLPYTKGHSVDVSKFKMSAFYVFQCAILRKPMLGEMNGNMHLPVPSVSRLNATDLATFSILSF
jgi:hypothetical protein